MPLTFPYIYISCPCVDISSSSAHSQYFISLFPPLGPVSNTNGHTDATGEEKDESTFDPRSPRANYSLYPLDHLLYCEDCHQIRCPRCVLEEVVCWYCPSCLFEVPSSVVKAEGNKCMRSCYQCPVCTAPLGVVAIEPAPSSSLLQPATSPGATPAGLWALVCPHCEWNSREIDLKFTKPNNISGQLAKMKEVVISTKVEAQEAIEQESRKQSTELGKSHKEISPNLDAEKQFASLKAFYKSQFYHTASPSTSFDLSSPYGYSSPRTISRLVDLYTGVSWHGIKELKAKRENMREACGSEEGLNVLGDDESLIRRIKELGWEGSRLLLPSTKAS